MPLAVLLAQVTPDQGPEGALVVNPAWLIFVGVISVLLVAGILYARRLDGRGGR